MSTHFVAVKNGVVVGTRTSASRHIGGAGKFGPYTHAVLRTQRTTLLASGAVTESTDVISWHSGAKNAAAGLRAANVGHTWTSDPDYRPRAEHYAVTYLAAELVEVVITPKKLREGAPAPDDSPEPSGYRPENAVLYNGTPGSARLTTEVK